MPQRHRAAVDVQLLVRDADLMHRRHGDYGEGLVDLEQVYVIDAPADLFDQQDAAYRESVLPPAVTARVAVEAGVTECWWRHVAPRGRVIGVDRFGESAPAGGLFEHYGFTVDHGVAAARDVLGS